MIALGKDDAETKLALGNFALAEPALRATTSCLFEAGSFKSAGLEDAPQARKKAGGVAH